MVPNDWSLALLDDGIELISGQHVDAQYVNNSGNGKPYLTGPADFPNGSIIVSKFTNHAKKECEKGDILITVKGSGTGKVIISDASYAISRQLMAIRPKSFDSTFCYYNLVANVKRYEGAAAGLIPGISREDVLNTPILVPPYPEQRKIASILRTWDKAIRITERLINNSKQQKKSLMQQLLTRKKRLYDDSGKAFEGDWEDLTVSSFGKVVTGNTPPKNDASNYGGHISWATAPDFKQKYVSNTKVKLTESGTVKARIVPKGSVLVTCIASIGKNAIANEALATNQQINAVVINNKHSNEFFYYLIEFNTHKLLTWAGKTAVPILNKTSFEKIKLRAPNKKEQQKIATVLTNADKETELLEQQLADLKQEKKALMQQLLTGKRRVIVDTPQAKEPS